MAKGFWVTVSEFSKIFKRPRQSVYIDVYKGVLKHRKIKVTKEVIQIYLPHKE